MKNSTFSSVACALATAGLLCGATSLFAADDAKAFAGRWALTLPGGGAGWLGVEPQADGSLKGSILWGGGSVMPVSETKVEGGALLVIRKSTEKKDGKELKKTETITAKLDGDKLALSSRTVNAEGKEVGKSEFAGKRIADLPPKPELSKVKFGAPVPLLNGKDMAGWKVMNEKAPNCWSVADGILSNRVMGPDGKSRHGTNIRTEAEFEDFNLKTEVRLPPGGNSGIYLRGIYEVQMAESFGKPCDSHHMGALYSRIVPALAAEKPANEWQTVDITLVDRHLTVILNGKAIIDNQPVLGCTGGAMTSDEFRPGPIYLQGDHTNVDYRNMVLTPVVK